MSRWRPRPGLPASRTISSRPFSDFLDYVLDHPMVAGVRHIELYCKPEMIPFYRKWGFVVPGDDVNFLRIEGRG